MKTKKTKAATNRGVVSANEENKMNGKCGICGKVLEPGKDGACTQCNMELCYECWLKMGRKCPVCNKSEESNPTGQATATA